MGSVIIQIDGVDNASPMLDKMVKKMDGLLLLANKKGDVTGMIAPGAERDGAALDGLGGKIGMTRKEWMRTGSESAYYLRAMLSQTGSVGGEISRVTGLVTQFGEAFMFGGGVGIALAVVQTGISAIIEHFQRLEREAKATRDAIMGPFEEAKKQIVEMTALKGMDVVAKQLGVSTDRLEAFVKASNAGANATDLYATYAGNLALKQHELTMAQRELTRARADYIAAGEGEQSAGAQAYYDRQVIKVMQLQNEIATLEAREASQRQEIILQEQDLSKLSTRYDDASEAMRQFGTSTVMGRVDWEAYRKGVAEVETEIKKVQDQLRNAQEQYAKARATFANSLIEKALTPTEVTDDDMRLTKLGLYKDKWDELRREAEDVDKNGAGMLSKYTKLQAALAETKLSAGEFARQFKDFSLFADPKNLKFMDMSALGDQVGQELLAMAGKANAMKEAIEKAFSSMSDPQKAALAKIGIRSIDDAFKKLNPDAKDMQKEMQALEQRLAKLQDSDTKLKLAKAEDFDKVLQEAHDAVTSNFPDELSTTIYVDYKFGAAGAAAKDKAGNKKELNSGGSSGDRNPTEYASGGVGVFENDQMIKVHGGEGFWISGLNWDVPMPGAGDGVTIQNMNVNNQIDAERAAQRIARAMKRRR